MKLFKIFIAIFFAIFITDTNAQLNFEFNYGDTIYHENVLDGIELNNGEFIFVGFKLQNQQNKNNFSDGLIFKINAQGQLINFLEYTKPDSNIVINGIEKIGQDYIIFGSVCSKINPNEDNLLISYIDENLNIIDENIYHYHDTIDLQHRWIYVNKLRNGKIIISGYKKPMETRTIPFLTKINLQTKTIEKDTIFNSYSNLGMFFKVLEDFTSNNYIVFGQWLMPESISQKLIVDTNFNFISLDTLSDNLGNIMYTSAISDTNYLLTGIDYYAQKEQSAIDEPGNKSAQRWDLGLLLMNKYHEKLRFFAFGKSGDTIDIPGHLKNINYIYKDAIYYGGTCDFYPIYFPGDKRPFMLVKMDSNVNVIWQKFYLTESCNDLNSVLATADGGCVLMGKKINFPATLDYDANAVIIKVDADGNFVSINEKESIQIAAQEAIVYPNPCRDVIHTRIGVHIKGNTFFSLYNLNGTRVLTKNIQQSYDQVSISSLSAGVYIYEFENNGKIIGKGKIIKQN